MTYNCRLELVPKIGSDCINCGLCALVCPINEPSKYKNKSLSCYAAYSNGFRNSSSSGGIASSLACEMLARGGAVCGCVFDGRVHHVISTDMSTINAMRGSKYVQSQIDDCYIQIKQLVATKKCLFVGTPCQVAGVKSIVGQSPNLYCVDLICHGTPSPKYLEEVIDFAGGCTSISFRENNNFTLQTDGKISRVSERYMLSFLNGLTFRESCYFCPFAENDRVGDITIGDFWEIQNFKEKEKGVSLVLVNNSKGMEMVEMISKDIYYEERTFDEAYNGNPQLKRPSLPHKNRQKYLKRIARNGKFDHSVKPLLYKERTKNWLKDRKIVRLYLESRR